MQNGMFLDAQTLNYIKVVAQIPHQINFAEKNMTGNCETLYMPNPGEMETMIDHGLHGF